MLNSIKDMLIGILIGMFVLVIYASHLENKASIAESQKLIDQYSTVIEETQEQVVETVIEAQVTSYELCIEVVNEDLVNYSNEHKKLAYEMCNIFL